MIPRKTIGRFGALLGGIAAMLLLTGTAASAGPNRPDQADGPNKPELVSVSHHNG